jgi:hypothetical protein
MAEPPPSGRDEAAHEREDRNLSELLQELRVALPGVQVLFAFLLTVPFTQRFADLSAFEKRLYFGVLLCTALSSAFLISPSVGHRILFRRQEKEYLVTVANRLALIGTGFLALAMCGAVAMVSHLVFGETATIVSSALVGVTVVALWYVSPLMRLRHDEEKAKAKEKAKAS